MKENVNVVPLDSLFSFSGPSSSFLKSLVIIVRGQPVHLLVMSGNVEID